MMRCVYLVGLILALGAVYLLACVVCPRADV